LRNRHPSAAGKSSQKIENNHISSQVYYKQSHILSKYIIVAEMVLLEVEEGGGEPSFSGSI